MKESEKSTYIIAEVGQNHNGDINVARKLIDMAAMPIFDEFTHQSLPGVNAVKFTKRDLTEELTVDAYNKPYDSPHSFGKTYGIHREALELTYDQHIELAAYARTKGLDFIETLTSIKTISLLNKIKLDAIKIASRDLTNLPLLEALAKIKQKMILSTGMGSEKEINDAIHVITKYHKNISILHCVSEYPAQYQNVNLRSISYLKENYPFEIGFSDHSIGIVIAPVAVALGATIIEKHITMNRSMKGSDHKASLEPEGLWRMVRDIRNVEKSLGKKQKSIPKEVELFKLKLERSIAANHDIQEGQAIGEEDLCLLSPGNGLRWIERDTIIGKKTNRFIPRHTIIKAEDLNHGNRQ